MASQPLPLKAPLPFCTHSSNASSRQAGRGRGKRGQSFGPELQMASLQNAAPASSTACSQGPSPGVRSHISAKAPGAALLKCEYLYNGSLCSPAGYPGSSLDHVAAFLNKKDLSLVKGLPDSSVGKESACHSGDAGSNPNQGRYSTEGNGNPLQYFCLGNPIDRGAWQAAVHGVTKESDMTQQLNNNNKP